MSAQFVRKAAVTLSMLVLGCDAIRIHAVTRGVSGETSEPASSSSSLETSSNVTSSEERPTLDERSTEQSSVASDTETHEATSVPVANSTGTPTGDASSTDESEPNPCSLAPPAGDTSFAVAVGSLERTYVLHVPPAFDSSRPAPLVIDFHGAGGSGWNELQTSPYPAETDRDNVVIAFPDGVNGPIGAAWNVGPCCVPGVDDLTFVDALLADVKTRVCIDERRIYAVGVLTGGGMAHYLACERSDVFAAVSPAAFDLAEETVGGCQPSRPVGVVAFRGTADDRVPYGGGSSMLVPNMTMTFLGAQASFERWASLNGCQGEPSAPDARGCSTYDDCPEGVGVVLCSKQGGAAEHGDATIAWPVLARHSR